MPGSSPRCTEDINFSDEEYINSSLEESDYFSCSELDASFSESLPGLACDSDSSDDEDYDEASAGDFQKSHIVGLTSVNDDLGDSDFEYMMTENSDPIVYSSDEEECGAELNNKQSDNIQDIPEHVKFKPENTTVNAAGHLYIPIKVNGISVNAILDTGAQVTVLNSKLAKAKIPDLKGTKKVLLKGINSDNSMQASLCEHVNISLGKNTFDWQIFLAPIDDMCILGLDFIVKFGLDIRLSDNILTVCGDEIPLTIADPKFDSLNVKLIKLDKKVIVRPRFSSVQCVLLLVTGGLSLWWASCTLFIFSIVSVILSAWVGALGG